MAKEFIDKKIAAAREFVKSLSGERLKMDQIADQIVAQVLRGELIQTQWDAAITNAAFQNNLNVRALKVVFLEKMRKAPPPPPKLPKEL